MDLLNLAAKITLDTKDYEKGVEEAGGKAQGFASKIGGGVKKAAKVGGIAIGAMGAAATGLGIALNKQLKGTAEYADNIDKMSQKMGLSAEKYQEWDFIMQHSGTSMESLKAGMKTLANAAENGNGAFERLGITQKQMASMTQEELFEATLSGLQNVTNETERTYLAGQLLGRGATELGALLNTSAEDTEAMKKQVHELGGVMSDKAVKAGAQFQDSLQNLNVSMDGLKNNFAATFLPGMSTLMDGLSLVITGDEKGFPLIEKSINDITENIIKILPKFLEIGARIIFNIGKAIVQNLPSLIQKLPQIIQSIITFFTDNISDIVKVGIDLTMALIKGLIESIPVLVESIPEIVRSIVQAFKDNKDMFKQIGKDLLTWVGEGLGNIGDWIKNKFKKGAEEADAPKGKKKKNGSHAGGLGYVPFDGYMAELHKGERVLTAQENRAYDKGGRNSNVVVNQNIYSQAKTAADLMQEALYQQRKAVFLGV